MHVSSRQLLIADADRLDRDAARLQQRHKLTPYAGRRLTGIVRTTLLRGERIWHDGRLVTPGAGRLL